MKPAIMKCYYEVLEVGMTISDHDLKLAYRRQAMKWHPDKNPDNLTEATEKFKLLQAAYDVLSDPQERAFYDKHRESILRGSAKARKEHLVDVYQYFTASCFDGYNDHQDGFYAVYRRVFEEIADEEGPHIVEEVEFACFGDSQSSYEDVVRPFYNFWEAFCTEVSFDWLDEHEPRREYGRKGNRSIMKENQKIRDAAKKERTEQIRSLVMFVKKRDRRVKAYLAKVEAEQKDRQKAHQEKREQEKRDKLKKMEEYKEAEWMSLAQLEIQLTKLELEHEQTAEEEDPLYCVACDKAFMSTKSFDNHVRSKKHRENEALLKHLMAEEEKALNGRGDLTDDGDTDSTDEEVEDEITNDENEPEVEAHMDANGEVDAAEEDDLAEKEERSPKDRKGKKKQRRQFVARLSESEADESAETELDSGLKHTPSKKEEALNTTSPVQESESAAGIESKDNGPAAPPPKLKGHKAKEAKRKAREEQAKAGNEEAAKVNNANVCVTCKCVFSSRNKLFQHFKSESHARYFKSNGTTRRINGLRK